VHSIFKRFREPIFVIALLAVPFVLFFVRAKKGRDLNALDRAVIFAIAPIEKVINLAAFAVVDAWQAYGALRGVREENLWLRRENLKARQLEQQAAELKVENERLRHLLDFVDRQPLPRQLLARVIAVGASPHSHTLRIARGSDDGISRGAAVIAPEGVVGIVSQLTGSYADVQLIVSPLSAVPAIAQRTRSRSTVKGTGDITRCKLTYALRTDDLQDGDVLVTAGGPGFFPQGLRVGRAVNVQKKSHGLFLEAEVLPAVDFSRLDEVSVVLYGRGEPEGVASGPGAPGSRP
jgi:rod shape-determining protein MreC